MPPRLVHSQHYFRLRQCVSHNLSPGFSTSSASRAPIPPESPDFIQIPRLVQPRQPFKVHLKGVLPIPRRILPRSSKASFTRQGKRRIRKASPEYIAAVTPEPLVDKTSGIDDEFVSWKVRQSELRRRNLREGLTELVQRKKENERRADRIATTNRRIREALLYAPDRQDVYLTTPSVLSTQLPTKYHALPDPNRPARLAVQKQNVADMAAMREETRRNALHSLYVNAGNFITTGKQLDGVIDRVFDDNSQFRSGSNDGINIWNLGLPETVEQLLGKANKTGTQTALESGEGNEIIMKERMRKISEELTGGKMLEEN